MTNVSASSYMHRACLLIVLLGLILLWAFTPQEYVASDPGNYSRRAFNILQNSDFGSSNILGHRLAVTVPVALLYALFGVNIHTTNLWPLIAVIVLSVTVWLALPDKKSKCIGVVLCLLCVPLLDSAVVLFPDIIAAAFMGLSSLMLFKRRIILQADKGHSRFLIVPIATVFLLFLAFLAKMSAYWVLPLWGLALAADVKDKDTMQMLRRFYLPAVITGLALGIGYLLFCEIIWGDPLARFKSINALTGHHLWSWDKQILSGEIVKRLTVGPMRLLLTQYGSIIILAFFGLFLSPPDLRQWAHYTIFCIFFFWFGSTSFTQYQPMPLVNRMALPALPGILVLAGFAASRLRVSSERFPIVNDLITVLLVLGIAALPFAKHIKSLRERSLGETRAMTLLQHEVSTNPDKIFLLLCSDQRSPGSLSFYFGYTCPRNLYVVDPLHLGNDLVGFDEAFVFVHEKRSRFLESAYGKRHFDEEIQALQLPIAYAGGDVVLFRTEQTEKLVNTILPKEMTKNERNRKIEN